MSDRTVGRSCVATSWSPLREISQSAGRRGARFPSIVFGDSAGYVIGNSVPNSGLRVPQRDMLMALSVSGEDVGRPDGDFTFVFPRAAMTGDGRLHLLWGEPRKGSTRTDSSSFSPSDVSTIWAASYDSLTGWTSATEIFAAGDAFWLPGIIDRPAAYPTGVTITVNRGNPASALARLVLTGSEWRVQHVPEARGAVQSSVAVLGDSAFIGFIAADRTAESDFNSVFLIRSHNGGDSWSQRSIVSRSGDMPAFDLLLRAAPDRSLHLLWRQVVASGASVLRHVRSLDDGNSWSAPDDLSTTGALSAPQAAFDRCGRLHVLFEHRTGVATDPHIDHAIWNGKWSTAAHLFPGVRAGEPDLIALADGRLALVVVSLPDEQQSDSRPRTLVSFSQPAADR